MSFDSSRSLQSALRALLPLLDVLNERVESRTAPAWCERRGWTEFLLSLSDERLARCEAEGLPSLAHQLPDAPASLVEAAIEVAEASSLPRLLPSLSAEGRAPDRASLRAVNMRKQAQLSSLLGAVAPMADAARRIVDVGAGSGHFTRIAAELFDRDALGLERDLGRVAAATSRAAEDATRATFAFCDALAQPLSLEQDDLAVGLHACGEVGDRLVAAASTAGCDLALVSCCLQKIGGPARLPLSREGAAMILRKETLGLANLTAQPEGVETSIAAALAARQTRLALSSLLRARGVALSPGEEMRGINRRRAHGGLRDVAERALSLRDLAPPTELELRRHDAEAATTWSIVRRLSLPRNMLARLVEVAVVLDRAAALQEAGHRVVVCTLFDRAVSPRNIGLLASRSGGRLPPVESPSSAGAA